MLDYDPVTGILRWRITSGRAYAGKEAGGRDPSTGYHRVRVDGIPILSHHVAWAIVEGVWPERVDHRWGKEAGNHWDNLRLCTQSQNMGNIGLPKNNTSGIKGVTFHKATGLWRAQIKINGKRKHLGCRPTKEEAGALYVEAAANHFGIEFSRTEEFPIPPLRPARKVERHPRRSPTVEELRAMLSYDLETGILRWGYGGPVAGKLTDDGYIRVGLFGKHYYAHVLIWAMVTGVWPVLIIHHVDAVRDNNRLANLTEITQAENVRAGYAHMRAGTAPLYRRKKVA